MPATDMKVLVANPALRFTLTGAKERYLLGAGCRYPFALSKDKTEYPRFAPFPMFLAHAAAVLEGDGFEVKAIDGVPLNLSDEEFLARASECQPDLILFEPATPALNRVSEMAQALAERTQARIVFAGPHVTTFARETLAQLHHVDFVLIGEYEMTVLALARALRDGTRLDGLAGVAYRNAQGEFCGGTRAPEIDPIDLLPPPARHLFPSYFDHDLGRYHDGFCQHRPAIQMHSSRGCPFRCGFCLWVQVMYGNGKHRCFSPARTVAEMIEARDRFGAKEIYFDDDDFTVRKAHVLALCEEIERRQVGLPWSVMGDAMTTDVEMLERMARAGCVGMKFGLESADPAVLRRIGKPVTLERVRLVAETARRLGIKTHVTVTLGHPGETRESMERTFAFCLRLDVDSAQFSVATPYPGTRFYQELRAAGRLQYETWEDFDGANNALFTGGGLDPEWVERLAASADGLWLRHKFKNPRWVLRQTRYLARLLKGQGFSGLWKRVCRGYRLLVQPNLTVPAPAAPEPRSPPAPARAIRQRVTGARP